MVVYKPNRIKKPFRGDFALSLYLDPDSRKVSPVLDWRDSSGDWIDRGERKGLKLLARYEGITQHYAAEITMATSGLEDISRQLSEINGNILVSSAA